MADAPDAPDDLDAPLFPFPARLEREGDRFAVVYTGHPDHVAYGLDGGDDPQTLAEDLFCVVLDVAERCGNTIRLPEPAPVGGGFAVRYTPRLARHLTAYGYALTTTDGAWRLSALP